jgi:hypothetical protein
MEGGSVCTSSHCRCRAFADSVCAAASASAASVASVASVASAAAAAAVVWARSTCGLLLADQILEVGFRGAESFRIFIALLEMLCGETFSGT